MNQTHDLVMFDLDGTISDPIVGIGRWAVDLIAARRNGLYSGGVLWGHGSKAELAGENPSYLFASPNELTTLAEG